MATLSLRLAAPMQSWGIDGKFSRRTTASYPTKSGVLGLCSAALGRRRTDPIEDLVQMKLGVRIDQAGEQQRDFQTAHGNKHTAPISQRYYLSDAIFLAVLESSHELCTALQEALVKPKFPLYLGRRAFQPVGKLVLGVSDAPMRTVLNDTPWLASSREMKRTYNSHVNVEVIRDVEPGETHDDSLRDVPVSFDPEYRRYRWRTVKHEWLMLDNPRPGNNSSGGTHDPFEALRGFDVLE